MRRLIICCLGCLFASQAVLFAADAWTNVTTETAKELPGNELQFLKEGQGGRIWIGTLQGLGTCKDGVFQTLKGKGKDGEKKLEISAWDVLETGPDAYWIGHGGGAIRMADGKAEAMLNGFTVAPILRFGDKSLLALAKNRGTERNALMQFTQDQWTPVELYKNEKVADLFQAANGTVWLTLEGNGVHELDPKKGLENPIHHLQGANVQTVAQDSKGRIWCGFWGGGVSVRTGEDWQPHLPKLKSAVLGIQEDKQGLIWLATNADGVFRYDGKEWVNDLKDEGSISLLTATRSGRIWVSSQDVGGLRQWDGKQWVVSLESPLPIRCLLEAQDGTLYAGGVLDGLHILKSGGK